MLELKKMLIKKEKMLIIFVLIVFTIHLSSSQVNTLPPVKQNNCVSLPQSYYNSTFQNISNIQFPNKTYFPVNSVMTNNGGGFFSYSFCNTSQVGQYIVNGFGDVDGLTQTWQYDFLVTPTGTESKTVDGILYSIVLLISIILFVLSLTRASTSQSISWILGGAAVCYFLLITIVFVLGKIVTNFITTLPAVGSFLDVTLIVLLVGIFPLILFMGGYVLMRQINSKEIAKMVGMGYSTEEAERYK